MVDIQGVIYTTVSKLPCWCCGKMYEPSSESIKAWAESGHDYDPTDWQCPECFESEK
mgnify:CR=1 FL=1